MSPNQGAGLLSAFTKNFGVTAVTQTSALLSWEVPESYKSEAPLKVRPGRPRRHGDARWFAELRVSAFTCFSSPRLRKETSG